MGPSARSVCFRTALDLIPSYIGARSAKKVQCKNILVSLEKTSKIRSFSYSLNIRYFISYLTAYSSKFSPKTCKSACISQHAAEIFVSKSCKCKYPNIPALHIRMYHLPHCQVFLWFYCTLYLWKQIGMFHFWKIAIPTLPLATKDLKLQKRIKK